METLVDEDLALEIESRAAEMAGAAGKLLQAHFSRPLEVEFKDDKRQDPVTQADKDTQAYLAETISRHFPGHGIVGEEGPDPGDVPAPDFLWVLDPLDGTTNFLNGLPVYAVSIGVIHRGIPLVGALFIPWPRESGGFVLHARRGGGAWIDGDRLSLPDREAPEAHRLTALPASFGGGYRVGKDLSRRMGQVRVTGSIAYEMALTASGVFQYVVFGGPRIWDIAAGVPVVTEAGGAVLTRARRRNRWEPLARLGPSWEEGRPTLKQVRDWVAPIIAGDAKVANIVAANLRRRRSFRGRVFGLVRKLRRGGK